MNVFVQSITWKGWQFGVLKVCMLALGMLIGVNFHAALKAWSWALWGVFVGTAILTTAWAWAAVKPTRKRPGAK